MAIELRSERRRRRLARTPDARVDHLVPLAEGVIEADGDGTVRAANGAAAELLGWDHPTSLTRELQASGWSRLGVDVGELRRELAVRNRWCTRRTLRRRDGSLLDAVVTACAVHASSGAPEGIVATIRRASLADALAAAEVDHPRGATAPTDDAIAVDGLPGHLSLHYQPELDLGSRAPVGAEALLRWQHPTLGVVSPGPALSHHRWAPRFAEVEVWSIFAVCRQISAWSDAGHPLPVAVNVSRWHLVELELVGRVRRALAASAIDPALLVVDLPVSALHQDPDRFRRAVAELDEVGVRCAVDDVTAAVPGRLLAGLPLTSLKLARPDAGAGAPRPPGTALATGLALARRLELPAVAKAIETHDQLAQIEELGVDRAFGHLLGPPQPADDLARSLWGAPRPGLVRRPRTQQRPDRLLWAELEGSAVG
ncbi:MAG: EAL domain-containing protein [Acidimicrobiales bacterium]